MLILPPDIKATGQGADLSYVKLFHRAKTGYANFYKSWPPYWEKGQWYEQEPDWEPLFPIRLVDELGRLSAIPPSSEGCLHRNVHFTINSFLHKSKGSGWLHSQPNSTKANLGWLNANWVDLDHWKLAGLGYYEMLGRMLALFDKGHVPMPSIMARSSEQGCWLFWLLKDEKHPDQPVPAYSNLNRKWQAVQDGLHETFAALGADPNGNHACHSTRVSGSFRTDKDSTVTHSVQFVNGAPLIYTLPELGDPLGIDLTVERTVVTVPNPKKARGNQARCEYLLADIAKLFELRKGQPRLKENYSCLPKLVGGLLRYLKKPEREVEARVWEACRQVGMRGKAAYKAIELSKEWKYYLPPLGHDIGGVVSNQRIADWAHVTPDEAKQLKLLPAASQYHSHHPKPTRRELNRASTALRRSVIQSLQAEMGYTEIRRMVQLLQDRQIKASRSQVCRDYRELGIHSA